jgi:hypothetical protein
MSEPMKALQRSRTLKRAQGRMRRRVESEVRNGLWRNRAVARMEQSIWNGILDLLTGAP